MDTLFEAGFEKLTVVFAKIAEHPKVRAIHPCNKHEGEIFTTSLFDLSRAKNATTVGVDENAGDQPGMVSPLPIAAVTLLNDGGVQLLNDIVKQVALMIVGQQIKNISGKQLGLIELNRVVFERY